MKKVLFTSSLVLLVAFISFAQDKTPYIRIVNIIVDSVQLNSFKAALKKHIQASVPTESGTLTLHAVYDKDIPTHVTVFEIYDSKEAHLVHQQTPHFLQYKNVTRDMVKSTERFKMVPIVLAAKPLSYKN